MKLEYKMLLDHISDCLDQDDKLEKSLFDLGFASAVLISCVLE